MDHLKPPPELDLSSTGPDALFVGAIGNANKTELTTDECHTTLQVEGHSVKFIYGHRITSEHPTTECVQETKH